jgi:hypothetical protein
LCVWSVCTRRLLEVGVSGQSGQSAPLICRKLALHHRQVLMAPCAAARLALAGEPGLGLARRRA